MNLLIFLLALTIVTISILPSAIKYAYLQKGLIWKNITGDKDD